MLPSRYIMDAGDRMSGFYPLKNYNCFGCRLLVWFSFLCYLAENESKLVKIAVIIFSFLSS